MDGLTTVLRAQGSVVPNQVNTIKLAIADAGDNILDSNVFIKSASFESVSKDVLELEGISKKVNRSEGKVELTVTRSGNLSNEVKVGYSTSDGSAVSGKDYIELIGELEFKAGESSKTISIDILNSEDFEFKTLYLNLNRIDENTAMGNNGKTRIIIENHNILEGKVSTLVWENHKNVDPQKNYIIRFSSQLNGSSVNQANIYVLDSKGEKVDAIKPELSANLKSVIMRVSGGAYTYKNGETYTLIIKSSLQNISGTPLGNDIKMNFTIEDLQ